MSEASLTGYHGGGCIAGSGRAIVRHATPIRTRCGYNNTTNAEVSFGLHTTDEMCAIVLYYWPAVGAQGLALCSN